MILSAAAGDQFYPEVEDNQMLEEAHQASGAECVIHQGPGLPGRVPITIR